MQDNILMGIWKFNNSISFNEILEVGDKWKGEPNFSYLYIRQVSKDQIGLGFTYIFDTFISEEGYSKFLDEHTDILKRQFGNDFIGWDISKGATLIKD